MSKKLLIIGKKNSSKTVFITQFYIRLQKGKSKLIELLLHVRWIKIGLRQLGKVIIGFSS
jgi:hypothetical protein